MTAYKDFVNGVLYGISTVNVTAPFGAVDFKVNGVRITWHNGIDMTPAVSVIPIAKGKVKSIGYNSSSGNYIFIEHGDGYESQYKHLKTGSNGVDEGDIVDRFVIIATAGKTGNVTGAHLHLGLLKDGKFIDPLEYLQGKKVVPPYEEVIMIRPELPLLDVFVSQLNYRDKPNGTKMGQLPIGKYPYIGRSQNLGGYEWAEIILNDKLVYCAINSAWNNIIPVQQEPIHIDTVQNGLQIVLDINPISK